MHDYLTYNPDDKRFYNTPWDEVRDALVRKDTAKKIALSIFGSYDMNDALTQYIGCSSKKHCLPSNRRCAGELFQDLYSDYEIIGVIASSASDFLRTFHRIESVLGTKQIDLLLLLAHASRSQIGFGGYEDVVEAEAFSNTIILEKLSSRAMVVIGGCFAGRPEGRPIAQEISEILVDRVVIACRDLCGGVSYRKPKETLSFPFAFQMERDIGAEYFLGGALIASVASHRLFLHSKL